MTHYDDAKETFRCEHQRVRGAAPPRNCPICEPVESGKADPAVVAPAGISDSCPRATGSSSFSSSSQVMEDLMAAMIEKAELHERLDSHKGVSYSPRGLAARVFRECADMTRTALALGSPSSASKRNRCVAGTDDMRCPRPTADGNDYLCDVHQADPSSTSPAAPSSGEGRAYDRSCAAIMALQPKHPSSPSPAATRTAEQDRWFKAWLACTIEKRRERDGRLDMSRQGREVVHQLRAAEAVIAKLSVENERLTAALEAALSRLASGEAQEQAVRTWADEAERRAESTEHGYTYGALRMLAKDMRASLIPPSPTQEQP